MNHLSVSLRAHSLISAARDTDLVVGVALMSPACRRDKERQTDSDATRRLWQNHCRRLKVGKVLEGR